MLEFRILGPLEVLDDDVRVPLGGRNQRSLLTLLLLRANEVVSTERLVDLLWGEHPPRTATTSLQNTVSQLRKLLGPGLLHTRPTGYLFEIDGNQLDLSRFELLVQAARSAEPLERGRLLGEALALWRGEPLADCESEEFAQEEIRRLADLRLVALEERIAADLDLGLNAELVGEIEALVRREPRRERLRCQLMLALYRAGRQAEALAAYHDARRMLVEDGIDPGPELKSLYGSILRQERSLAPTAAVGLDDHYDEVVRALSSGRLVPVLGSAVAGLGGDELAAHLADRFGCPPDRVRSLAAVSQYVAARNGIGPLHDELHDVLDRDFEPSVLHAWLAALPSLLRARGLPHQLIVTTGLDTSVERAFGAVGEELDIVSYIAAGRDRGRFLHVAPDGSAVVIDEPNAYTALSLDARSVLLKVHGQVDRAPARDRESFAVSEDDHIDYLAAGDAVGTVPVQLAARLRRSHLLFIGYAVDDWSLRVFLRRVWGHDRLAYRSWAVQPAAEPVARELWHERGAEVYDVAMESYADELMRLAGELTTLDAAV